MKKVIDLKPANAVERILASGDQILIDTFHAYNGIWMRAELAGHNMDDYKATCKQMDNHLASFT